MQKDGTVPKQLHYFNTDYSELEERLFGSTLYCFKQKIEYDGRLRKMWDIMETRFSDPSLDLNTLSRECGMSKSNINFLLKSLTGLTFYRILTGYRVYRSIQSLQASNSTFTEVALATGFSDSSTYSRTVKRVLNVAPRVLLPRKSDYRRQLQLPQTPQATNDDWRVRK